MEQFSLKNLPEGTLDKMKKRAKKNGFKMLTKPEGDLAAYVRNWFMNGDKK